MFKKLMQNRVVAVSGAVLGLVALSATSATAGQLIGSAQIRDNTVKSQDIRDNGVRSADIRDGAVGASDLNKQVRQLVAKAGKPGQKGDQGKRGEQGPVGPAGKDGADGQDGADGVASTEIVEGAAVNGGRNSFATCPEGTLLTGGGYRLSKGEIVVSYPKDNTWVVTGSPLVTTENLRSFAVCATATN